MLMTDDILFVYALCGYLFGTVAVFSFFMLSLERNCEYYKKFLVEKGNIQEFEDWKHQRKLQLKNINP
jgi:hypothetical protein